MSKIKKVWQENKVLLVLAIILIMCLVIFVVVAMVYFYGTSDNVYGNRLDVIKDTPLSKEVLNNVKNNLVENESVVKEEVSLLGKILYINIEFTEKTKMEDAKKIAEKTLEVFSEEQLKKYDIQYTISVLKTEKTEGYTIMGARNANGSGMVVWNNYNISEGSKK